MGVMEGKGGYGEGKRGEVPSALELEWIAHIRMHFETVCERSAMTRKTFIDILDGQRARMRLLMLRCEVVELKLL